MTTSSPAKARATSFERVVIRFVHIDLGHPASFYIIGLKLSVLPSNT